ncbi:MAG: hypothetical protein HYV95_03660 [Opitutae bacterium]|nr:hypothetical protein [Opitutae bacterium]
MSPAFPQTTLYWDSNKTTAGSGNLGGSWSSTSKKWSTAPAGNIATQGWIGDSSAIFSAGTDSTGSYTVNVVATQTVKNITVEEGNPTLRGGSLNFSVTTSTIDVAANSTLTLSNSLDANGSMSIVTAGSLTKSGEGTLALAKNLSLAGSLNISGGTLLLSGTNYSFGTMDVTGNSIIDFVGNTTLSIGTLVLAPGATLTIRDWLDASDAFSVTTWTGATMDTKDVAPMNQVSFVGNIGPGSIWESFDHRVRPVPEPSHYGAILVGTLGGIGLFCRFLNIRRQ